MVADGPGLLTKASGFAPVRDQFGDSGTSATPSSQTRATVLSHAPHTCAAVPAALGAAAPGGQPGHCCCCCRHRYR